MVRHQLRGSECAREAAFFLRTEAKWLADAEVFDAVRMALRMWSKAHGVTAEPSHDSASVRVERRIARLLCRVGVLRPEADLLSSGVPENGPI